MKKETSSDPKFATKTPANADPALVELFKDSIMDIYWAENHLVKMLPKMIEASSSKKLKQTITTHLDETKVHVQRLQEVFGLLGEEPLAKKCEAMEGLVLEGQEIVESTEPGTATRDVGIILASQKVEHYEIATYGGLTQLAKTLGLEDVAGLLAKTLAEEKNADVLLTEVAEKDINYQASAEA